MRSYEKETTLVNSEIIEYALTDHLTSFNLLPRLVEIMPPLPEEKETLELYNHTGEEFIYILEGILTMNIDGITYQLYPGDSVHIPSCIPHNWSNKTNHITKILTVHSPNPLKKKADHLSSGSAFLSHLNDMLPHTAAVKAAPTGTLLSPDFQ